VEEEAVVVAEEVEEAVVKQLNFPFDV